MKIDYPLQIHEIDFRVQSITPNGWATILAYKDARADMNRLDAVYGSGFWQRKHEVIGGNLYCSVGVWNHELKQWVWVEDVGTESYTEKEKGQASDSFKRACFNLGIGRELYGYPYIGVQLNQDEYFVSNNGGKQVARQSGKLKINNWSWVSHFDADNSLSFLQAQDLKGNVRFKWGKETNAPYTKDQYDHFYFMLNSDGFEIEVYSFLQITPGYIKEALISSFPRGRVSEYKDILRKKESKGYEDLQDYHAQMVEFISKDDKSGVQQILSELSGLGIGALRQKLSVTELEYIKG